MPRAGTAAPAIVAPKKPRLVISLMMSTLHRHELHDYSRRGNRPSNGGGWAESGGGGLERILKSDEGNCQIQNHEISNPDLRFHDFGFGSFLFPISKFLLFQPRPAITSHAARMCSSLVRAFPIASRGVSFPFRLVWEIKTFPVPLTRSIIAWFSPAPALSRKHTVLN